jgi:hypothetical protein
VPATGVTGYRDAAERIRLSNVPVIGGSESTERLQALVTMHRKRRREHCSLVEVDVSACDALNEVCQILERFVLRNDRQNPRIGGGPLDAKASSRSCKLRLRSE